MVQTKTLEPTESSLPTLTPLTTPNARNLESYPVSPVTNVNVKLNLISSIETRNMVTELKREGTKLGLYWAREILGTVTIVRE